MSRDARKPWMAKLGLPGTPRRSPGASAASSAANSDSTNATAPPASGLGLTSNRLRTRLVDRLMEQGIRDSRVLAAMAGVPRHQFVDEALASRAYEDIPLPIGHGQTISQPFVVARMTEVLCNGSMAGKVLEIGTGCGYQTAVLSRVATEVYSIERIRALHNRARDNLRSLRLANVRLIHGDGMLGIPEAAPFDAILIAAAAPDLPRGLLEQLRVGGRIVAPLGSQDQTLCLIVRTGEDQWQREDLAAVRFVPLRPGTE